MSRARRATSSAFWAIVCGLALGLVLFLAKEVTDIWAAAGLPPVHFTYVAIIMFVFSFAVMALVSLAGPSPAPDTLVGTTFQRGDLRPEPPQAGRRPGLDHRITAAALALLMVGTILAFW